MNDELYEEAKKIVLEQDRASVALLQRTLGIGYKRAASLMEILEANGVIHNDTGNEYREIVRELKPCTCKDPLCARCMLIDCTDDQCETHPLDKKKAFRELYRKR